MKTIFMTKGLPGSGKSTLAWDMLNDTPTGSIARVNKDDLRAMLHGGQWSKGNEKLVLKIRDSIIADALEAGQHVIVDDTNLHPKHEQRLRELAKEHSASFDIIDLTDVPLDTCHKQNLKRANPVPAHVIDDMWSRYLKPTPDTSWMNPGLPPCMIVDLDGTLAHMNGRGPYDWDKVGSDTLDQHVNAVMATMLPYKKIILSGRDSVCRLETLEWLKNHNVYYDELWMRPEKDMRKDSIVKRELFDAYIRGRYNPVLVIDDRKQVVDMWRNDLGLTVWQVAEGNF